MRKDSSEKLTGNAQFEGYAIDLIHEISRILGFNYSFRLVPDGRYGSFNKETKEWDGMIKELLEQVKCSFVVLFFFLLLPSKFSNLWKIF